MQIVTYPHPTLRHVSKAVRRVDARLREMIREMFTLMYEANGVGLAANQVEVPVTCIRPAASAMLVLTPLTHRARARASQR